MSTNSCYNFMKTLTEELTQSFDKQYESMEDFARWNLSEEIALEWIDAQGIIEIISKDTSVSIDLVNTLIHIKNNFIKAFENNYDVWTYDAMKESDFWNSQRILAEKALKFFSQTINDL